MNDDKIKSKTQVFNGDWQEGFDSSLKRADPKDDYLGGANFDATLDELLFNRMLMLKNVAGNTLKPQGNDLGKIFWDKDNNKYKLWVGKTLGGFVDVQWTSTSTSSTSSSSSSSSTSSTSSSSTSHSTSSSSTSTTHT